MLFASSAYDSECTNTLAHKRSLPRCRGAPFAVIPAPQSSDLRRTMRLPVHVSGSVGRSAATLLAAALVANPLNTVLQASTYQPSPEVQQLRFDVLAAAQGDTQQLVFPSELLAATDAPSKPLTRAERAKAAQAKSTEPVAATAPEPASKKKSPKGATPKATEAPKAEPAKSSKAAKSKAAAPKAKGAAGGARTLGH